MKLPKWMWPEKPAPEVILPERKEEPLPPWWPLWLWVKAEYPVGRKFEHLGRTMMVVRQGYYDPGFRSWVDGFYIPPTYPAIYCQCADERGVIHDLEFAIEQYAILCPPKEISGGLPRAATKT